MATLPGAMGSYDVGQYFKEIDLRLQRHFDNYGRFHTPVADASFDTWLDGYAPGFRIERHPFMTKVPSCR